MKICKNCQKEIFNDDKYCRYCGTIIRSKWYYLSVNLMLTFLIIFLILLLLLFALSFMYE